MTRSVGASGRRPALRTETRDERLVGYVREQGFCTMSELASSLGVSEMTVRRAVQRLADRAGLRVVHGGVTVLPQQALTGSGEFDIRARDMAEAKRAIALRAVELVRSGETIGIDAGSTGLQLAMALPPENGNTIATYSVAAIDHLMKGSRLNVVGLGGTLHRETQSFSGPLTVASLQDLRVDTFFVSASGIHEGAIYCGNDFDAVTKRAFIKVAGRVVLIADSSKFSRSAMVRICSMKELAAVVTDDGLAPAQQEALERLGLEVIRSVPGPAAGPPATVDGVDGSMDGSVDGTG